MENERKGAGSRLRHASHFRSYDRESSGFPAVTSRGSDRAEQPLAVNELELLKPVSRSFYLSIRLLPRALREPVALAYLLARTSDTIADSNAILAEKRVELLDRFARAIAGKDQSIGKALKELLLSKQDGSQSSSRSRGTKTLPDLSSGITEGEKALLESAEKILRALKNLSPEDQRDVRELLAIITRGQREDLTRWSGGLAALANAQELLDYTYLVAGCVGEFWTRVCSRKVQSFTARLEADMLELGTNYGRGLQLVNILRDAGSDLRAGRCYFPEDELRAAELSASDLPDAPAAFLPIYSRWIAEARAGLDAGLEYAIAINPARVRVATVLPALIGVRTLSLLEESGLDALRTRDKVPRSEVRGMIASTTITLASQTRLRRARAQL
ncbi:MAG: farnesyl-diphosphate farnesyltransferase [Verrucomicrobia bacterium]|nr:MAG: farnesyl-diphosphate farnesyltransferase [Verrucomicrobiota bacterium]